MALNQVSLLKYFGSLHALSMPAAYLHVTENVPGRVAQSVGHLTHSEVLGSIPGLVTYFRFSFR